MKILDSNFVISATKPTQYPKDDLKEIVLVGKSNVGKSTFINTLTNRKKLARTSSTPGKTRQINFYKIRTDEKDSFYFVDLPGYGFSKMSLDEQVKVGKFIEEYLVKSSKIALVVLLIDIRHDPSENDKMMYDYIVKQNLPAIVICNKADKLAVTKVDPQVKHLQELLNPLRDLTFSPFSSERKIYLDNTMKLLENYL
jgi:GTP-binding protein